MFMKHATDLGTGAVADVAPILGICGSVFMVIAAFSCTWLPALPGGSDKARAFACPIVFYLIVFAVVIVIGLRFYKQKK